MNLHCRLVLLLACLRVAGGQEVPAGTTSTTRSPWTSSRIVGTPEPPLEFSVEPAFPKLFFNDSMHVRWQADLQRYFVVELGGKIWSFPHDPDVAKADLVVDLRAELKSFDPAKSNGVQEAYSLIFDPNFANNRFVYVCTVLSTKSDEALADAVRVSRFTIKQSSPPTIDVASELKIISWRGGGHNGCDLAFDHTGCLMISCGDATAPSPPDILRTGQDISDLLSSILRIDVRGATDAQPYKIPVDNPFVDVADARPEVWAYGFRNPWRIAVDPNSNDLWVGDVGWEKWELVHRVQKGGNHGWSVREGFELIQPDIPVGPTAILPPRVALSHAEAASITGGFVYCGHELPSIKDHYLFGDWVNGRIWAVSTRDASAPREIASATLRIIAFSEDRDGLPLVVNHLAKTSLFRLVPNSSFSTAKEQFPSFPKLLSETGLYADTARQIPTAGVRQFTINQPQWSDGTTSRHYLALPGLSQLQVFDSPQPLESLAMFNGRLHYPVGAVLAKTISWQDRPIETQILHFDGRLWRGYSYVWNTSGTDAALAPSSGLEVELPNSDGRSWTIHGRSTCLQCHNPWSNFSLALTPEQLHSTTSSGQSQWQTLVAEGYVRTLNAARQPIAAEAVVNRPLSNSKADQLEHRARSYLHVNCAHCHQFGAGSGVSLSLRLTDNDAEMNCFGVLPAKGQFEIADGRLVASGDPLRSVLLFRMASSTIGRMPHIGSKELDMDGIVLVADWIRSLDPSRDKPLESSGGQESSGRQPRSQTTAQSSAQTTAESSAQTSAQASTQPIDSPDSIQQTLAEALQRAAHRIQGDVGSDEEFAALQTRLDQSTPVVSSLLEGFLPAAKRVRRLGPLATFADVGSLVGNVDRGRQLFHDKNRLQCANCHRIESSNSIANSNAGLAIDVGPDLTAIGQRLNAQQLFEAIAEPNRQIEPRYQSSSVLRLDGSVVVGILQAETEKELVLRTATGDRVAIPLSEIEQRQTTTQSLMPSGLVQQLTAQEMADLIAYLLSANRAQQ